MDVIKILKAIAGVDTEIDEKTADIDASGTLTIIDALLVLKKAIN